VGSDLLLAWRSGPLGVYVVDCLQTALQYGPTSSVRSWVTVMIIEARYADDLRPALACVNNQPERTARWPELMDDSRAGRKLCHVSRQLGSTVSCRGSALYNKTPGVDRPGCDDGFFPPTTRERRQQVSGVVARMNDAPLFGDKYDRI
jgi:hypothetical protein